MTRVVIVVATLDAALERAILQRRETLLPDTFRRNNHQNFGGNRITISCYLFKRRSTATDLVAYIEQFADPDIAGVILTVDRRLRSLANDIQNIVFVVPYNCDGEIKSPTNFFGALFGRILRDYKVFASKFDDQKFRKLFTLPIRNFRSFELQHLCGVCADASDKPGFADRLEAALKSLQRRQKPKRFEDNPNQVYLKDEEGKHFRIGMERHAQAETAKPPHNDICVLGNIFRFGRRFDSRLHYNVTKDESGRQSSRGMDGAYPNCHSALTPGGGKSHLNMFPNDFF
jgi:hypothetical protein